MRSVVLSPPAKVNLFLRVLAREPSGYHRIETLFQAVDLRDRLEIRRGGDGLMLEVHGAEVGPVEENLVWKAASAFATAAGVEPALRIRLEKCIPAAAGLGGGSSDAASTLLGLNRMHGHPLDDGALVRLASRLGSDVPFFLSPSPLALGWGRGTRLLPLPPLPAAWVVLALPPVEVETAEAFRALSASGALEEAAGEAALLPGDVSASWSRVAGLARNDFEPGVLRRHPLLAGLRRSLEEAGPLVSGLSGSGSALFAVFPGRARAAESAASLASTFPDVRFECVRTLSRLPRP